jgi:GTP cyclohydrolase I
MQYRSAHQFAHLSVTDYPVRLQSDPPPKRRGFATIQGGGTPLKKNLLSDLATPPARPRARPSQAQAEDAVRVLLDWSGDDSSREGLLQTPQRVAEAFKEYFSGYREDPITLLQDPVMEDVSGYDDIVLLKNIEVLSHCEHHLSPFMGRASVAYLPEGRVAGLSRLARVVDALARRLQTQEALTAQIAESIDAGLAPRGVAVIIEAEHQCIAARGIRQHGLSAITTRFLGEFATNEALRDRFLRLAGK